MVDFFHRMLRRDAAPQLQPPETLTPERIAANYRLFWTKIALGWESERRARVAAAVTAVIAAPDFEANLLERRYRVEAADDLAHSGASLLALAEVLRALAAMDAMEEENG